MAYPATSFSSAVDLTITAANQIHEVVNGDSLSTVLVETGEIPSLRKALVDNFYFISPIDWDLGNDETVFNQLRTFTDGSVWWSPTATVSNPVTMTADPYTDSNWTLSIVGNKNYIDETVNAGDSLVAGGLIYPIGSESITVLPPYNSPVNAIYLKHAGVLYESPIPLSGSITSIVPSGGGVLSVTISGVVIDVVSTNGVSSDVEYTVGAGGIFSSINEAIDSIYRMVGKYRIYSNNTTPIFTIRLLSGFIMTEQVWYESCDLGFIRIISDDPVVTIQRSALTRPVGNAVIRYMTFVFRKSCIGPTISVLFDMDTSGDASGRGGVRIEDNSYCYISAGAGITNVPDRGLHLVTGRADASSTIWDGAGNRGIRVGNQSMINAESVSCRNCGESGIAVDSASSAIFRNAVCDGATINGALVIRSENVDLTGLQANDCGSYGANIQSSKVTLEGCELLRAGVDGLIATDNSIIAGKTSNISDSVGRNVFARNNCELDLHGGTYTGAGTSNIVAQSFTEIDASTCDLKGAIAGYGVFADLSSEVNVNSSDMSNAALSGIAAFSGSEIACRNATANNCGEHGAIMNTSTLKGTGLIANGNTLDGVRCESGSTASVPLGSISNNGRDNIFANNASIIDVHSTPLSGAGRHNINVSNGSDVDASSATATGATSRGIICDAATVSIRNADISGSGSASDALVQSGSIVRASGATGTFSIPVNTLTANGIVFQ